jgi:crossover junction endodeoxyribonuclease RuvC
MIVLGIDPGNAVTGYGFIRSEETFFECLVFGTIRPKPQMDFQFRLKHIYDQVNALIHQHQPDSVSFEDIFFNRNFKSALQLGQARGAAILAAINSGKPIAIYSPREVKQALTGNGSAAKEQVQIMVQHLLQLTQPIVPLDASDALAIAICHANRYRTKQRLKINQT